MHSFGVIAVLSEVLHKILHRVAAYDIPEVICLIVPASFNFRHELAHSAFFPEVRKLIEQTADENQDQPYRDRNFQPLLQRPRLLRYRMVVVNETADN